MSDNPDVSTGIRAPDFNLPASNGTNISLADYLTKKNIYLFFVRAFV